MINKKLLAILLGLLTSIALGAISAQDTEGKKFKLRSKDNNINIVFVDAAAKSEFIAAIASRGSYNPGTAENPNPQSREDFVLSELETLFSDWITQARIKVADADFEAQEKPTKP
jgi:hypothetical protein